MGYYKNKNNKIIGGFVALTWHMLNSQAYKELPFSAAKALPYFLGKVKVPHRDPKRLNEDFTFSYPEAVRLGFSRRTFSRVISSLIEHGFIDPVEKGGLRGYGCGYNVFKQSFRWKNYGKKDFKEISWKDFYAETF